MAKIWDVPKRDLLDIERTAQAESVEAGDALAIATERLLAEVQLGGGESRHALRYAEDAQRAVEAYRVARGQDTGSQEPHEWSAEDILRQEG